MKFLLTVILLSSTVLCSPFVTAAENYCNDQESWKEWDALIQKYPDDLEIQALHALRLGLCAKVERGDITVEQATAIFERAREAILEKKRSEARKEKERL